MRATHRTAAAEDWPAIARLLEASDLPLAGARDHLDGFVVVAEAGGEIVGCAGAEVFGDVALLRSLGVAEASRGRGIAHALVNLILTRLRARGVERVALLTMTAEHFFARLGFVVVPRADLPGVLEASEELKGACPASATAMLLRL